MPRQKKQHLKQRKDGRYCCRYQGHQFMGNTEEEALQAREEYKLSMIHDAPVFASVTLGEYGTAWIRRAKVGISFSTYNEAAVLLEKLLSVLGDKPLRDILPSDIKAVYSAKFDGLSDSYIRTAAILYRSLFDAAVADGLCRYNPARDKTAKPHKGTYTGHRAITPQERHWIDTLCLDHRCRPVVMAMLYEGLRPPEAKALDLSAVDRVAGMLHLRQFAHKAPHGHYKVTQTGKTQKAARDIPLFSPFLKAIEGKSGPLVPTIKGGELTIQAWRVCWNSYVNQMEQEINGMQKRWYGRTREHKAILAAGGTLPPWISFTVRPYDLRHSFCTMCRDAGVEINTCIKWMGHADAKMILKVYDEVSPDRIKTEAEKLEKALIDMQNGMQKRTFHVKRRIFKASKR